jgi:hypothetical protein
MTMRSPGPSVTKSRASCQPQEAQAQLQRRSAPERPLALAPSRTPEVAPPAVRFSVFLSISDHPSARSQLARPARRLLRASPCLKRQDSVPVSMMCALWVKRPTTAFARRASGKTFVRSPKGRLVVTLASGCVGFPYYRLEIESLCSPLARGGGGAGQPRLCDARSCWARRRRCGNVIVRRFLTAAAPTGSRAGMLL